MSASLRSIRMNFVIWYLAISEAFYLHANEETFRSNAGDGELVPSAVRR